MRVWLFVTPLCGQLEVQSRSNTYKKNKDGGKVISWERARIFAAKGQYRFLKLRYNYCWSTEGNLFPLQVQRQAKINLIQTLTKHNILSAPILDAKTGKYIGLIDMLDLVTFVVDIYKSLEREGESADFFSLLESGERFVTQEIKTIADLSHRNPFVPINETDTLLSVLSLIGHQGLHRVPVVDGAGTW